MFYSFQGYPKEIHAPNISFTYSIVVGQNKFIKMTFEDLNIDDGYIHYNCPIKLLIFDGLLDMTRHDANLFEMQSLNSLPPPKVRLCTSALPAPIASDSNAVTVVFSLPADSGVHAKFRLKWESINRTQLTEQFDEHREGIPASVNSTFNIFADKVGQPISLLDGNYSEYLVDSSNGINWYIRTHSWAHFNLTWSGVSFPNSEGCWKDRIRVLVWKGSKFSHVKSICTGASIKPLELSGSNLLCLHLNLYRYLSIRSAVPRFLPQYNITLVPVCGGNFTSSSGTINSEEVVGKLPTQTCRWLVKVRPGRTIEFTLDYYSIGYCGSTFKEALKLYNGNSESSPLLVKPICDTNTSSVTLPQTSGNVAYLVFKSSSVNDVCISLYFLT